MILNKRHMKNFDFQPKFPNRLLIEFIRSVNYIQIESLRIQSIHFQNPMPRAQKLSQLNYNKVYQIEGTLKFIHESEGYTTAVIEQEAVQRKIKIPLHENQLQEGVNYRFANCFYNSQGWLMARKPNESIEIIRPSEDESSSLPLNLKEISEKINTLETNYFSTFLKIYSIQPKQVLNKNEKDIKYQVLKGYSSNCLIDVTIWNSEIESEFLLNQWVLFKGMRIKKMTEEKFVLVSTVFTKLSLCDWVVEDQFFPHQILSYENMSEIYRKRELNQLSQMGIPQNKIFSIIKAKIKSIISTDYQGCSKCRRKIEERCDQCNLSNKTNYTYGKVVLEEGEANIEVIVFDEKIKEMFKFAKENCSIEGQVKTFGRVEEGETVVSHILTKINSIFF